MQRKLLSEITSVKIENATNHSGSRRVREHPPNKEQQSGPADNEDDGRTGQDRPHLGRKTGRAGVRGLQKWKEQPPRPVGRHRRGDDGQQHQHRPAPRENQDRHRLEEPPRFIGNPQAQREKAEKKRAVRIAPRHENQEQADDQPARDFFEARSTQQDHEQDLEQNADEFGPLLEARVDQQDRGREREDRGEVERGIFPAGRCRRQQENREINGREDRPDPHEAGHVIEQGKHDLVPGIFIEKGRRGQAERGHRLGG